MQICKTSHSHRLHYVIIQFEQLASATISQNQESIGFKLNLFILILFAFFGCCFQGLSKRRHHNNDNEIVC